MPALAATCPGAHLTCGECRRHPPPWSRLFALWSYRRPGDLVIRGLKFHGLAALGEQIARIAFDRWAEELVGFHSLVPVPLPWTRRVRRGFNQAEVIARPLGHLLRRPTLTPLRRRLSRPQSLTRGRRSRTAVGRSIDCRSDVDGLRILLVDDVITSGATLRACTAALRRRGAAEVAALVAARTPAAGEWEGPPTEP